MAGTRAITRSKRKSNENPKSGLSSNCRQWGHNDVSGWHGKENQVNRVRSSSSSTLVATDVDTKEVGGKRSRELAWYGRWFPHDQSVLRGLCDFRACVSEKLCHLRDFVSKSLGYGRGGVERDESARRSVHSESLRCRL